MSPDSDPYEARKWPKVAAILVGLALGLLVLKHQRNHGS